MWQLQAVVIGIGTAQHGRASTNVDGNSALRSEGPCQSAVLVGDGLDFIDGWKPGVIFGNQGIEERAPGKQH